jgi:hypothetical protein
MVDIIDFGIRGRDLAYALGQAWSSKTYYNFTSAICKATGSGRQRGKVKRCFICIAWVCLLKRLKANGSRLGFTEVFLNDWHLATLSKLGECLQWFPRAITVGRACRYFLTP